MNRHINNVYVLSHISQGILKYTVFWLPLKRRQWSFFYNIFEDEAETISVEEWVSAGYGLAMKEEVGVGQVRFSLWNSMRFPRCGDVRVK